MKGFTLIELLGLCLIIGIWATEVNQAFYNRQMLTHIKTPRGSRGVFLYSFLINLTNASFPSWVRL